jgi:exonuclease VII large subunit
LSIQRTTTSVIFDPDLQFLENQPVVLTAVEEQPSFPDNAMMLNQTFDVIEEQNKAVQAEFAITLQQAQNTIQNLQNAQQALLLENAQWRAQVTVLESQNNQMNAAHQADMRAALERNKTLEEALNMLQRENVRLRKTVEIHERGFSNLEIFHNELKKGDEDYWRGEYGRQWSYPPNPTDDQIAKTKQELRSLSKEKI